MVKRCFEASETKTNRFMKHIRSSRSIFSLPTIGLLLALLLGGIISHAQTLFTVDVKGKGKPMLLIHGLNCSGAVWKETVERYQNKYECHVLTVAGFGGTTPSANDPFLAAVKDDIVAYVKNKKLNKPVLMGHSMGAFISIWAAASASSLFDRVIAVDGVPFMSALQTPTATSESAKPMADQVYKATVNQTPEQAESASRYYLSTMVTSPERLEQLVALGKQADIKTSAKVMYEMFTTDLRPVVSKINCPLLLLGSWIAYKPYGATRESARQAYQSQVTTAPNAKVEMTDTAKHFIFYDDPAWFYGKVDGFLGR